MSKRLYALDLVRFISAIAVMLYHYLFRGWKADNMSNISFPEIGSYFKYGYLGVDVFFIVSGFVIFLSIQKFSVYNFVKSRVSRIYPAYWFGVLFTFFVTVCFGGERYLVTFKQLIYNLTMLNGFFGVKSIDGVYWTLLVELKFYILIFLYLLLIKFNKIFKNLVYFVYSWLAASLLYSLLTLLNYDDFFLLKVLNYFLLFEYSHYFIAGSLFYLIYKEEFKYQYFLGIIATFLLSLFWAFKKIHFFENKYNSVFSSQIVVVFIFFTFLFFGALCLGKLKFLNRKVFIRLGLITYPLYLVHQNVGFILFNLFKGEFSKYTLLIAVSFFMIFLSYLINVFIEERLSLVLKKGIDKVYKNYVSKK